jgi:osmotically-inducible protein OsmY
LNESPEWRIFRKSSRTGIDWQGRTELKTDIQLQDDVRQELKWANEVDARHVAVTTKDGSVTLSGYVSAYIQKLRAVTAAERVYGVKAVADEIEVRVHDSHVRDDSDIAESVARILEWNATLAGQNIQAKVANGHVTLRGEVDWNHQREEAANAIYSVLGVTVVTNAITVKPRAVIAQVEKQITNALTRHAALDARQINVTTSGSTATLTGHVHSLDEARVAKRAALSAPGISNVEDRLVIQP